MRNMDYEQELNGLSSAEDFLDFFEIDYDPHVVFVNRLHILQRFHDYIEKDSNVPAGEEACRNYYRQWLTKSYEDFVSSDALTEKVFKVFHPAAPQTVFVPLGQLRK